MLLAILADALGAADEVVDERADDACEHDDEDPHDLVIAFGGFVGDGINENPNPDCQESDAKETEDRHANAGGNIV